MRETCVPGKLSEEQAPPVSPQEIEPSFEVTVPLPPPVTETFRVMPNTNVADTVVSAFMVTTQLNCELGVPEQAPPQLCSKEPESGAAYMFTIVPLK